MRTKARWVLRTEWIILIGSETAGEKNTKGWQPLPAKALDCQPLPFVRKTLILRSKGKLCARGKTDRLKLSPQHSCSGTGMMSLSSRQGTGEMPCIVGGKYPYSERNLRRQVCPRFVYEPRRLVRSGM